MNHGTMRTALKSLSHKSETMEICADCGKPIGVNEGSYYRKLGDNSDIGQTFHAMCGDPFGLKTKDAEIAQLRTALQGILDLKPEDMHPARLGRRGLWG